MRAYMIDYIKPDGTEDFKVVRSESKEEARKTFRNAGIDGWTGYMFSEYKITGIEKR